ncbi:MAG: hypothetical protein EXR62_10970 [Chloroflexi bacterium]|nr:hypothetical protein [Chloroflexota bacterium]
MNAQQPRKRQQVQVSLLIIALGILLLIAQLTGLWFWGLFLLALVFLGSYFFVHNYNALVPGGILAGMWVGFALNTLWQNLPGSMQTALFLIPFGLGFALIWVLDRIYTRQNNWWPLVPAVLIVVSGLAIAVGGIALNLIQLVGNWWPLAVIGAGGYALFKAARGESLELKWPWVNEQQRRLQ